MTRRSESRPAFCYILRVTVASLRLVHVTDFNYYLPSYYYSLPDSESLPGPPPRIMMTRCAAPAPASGFRVAGPGQLGKGRAPPAGPDPRTMAPCQAHRDWQAVTQPEASIRASEPESRGSRRQAGHTMMTRIIGYSVLSAESHVAHHGMTRVTPADSSESESDSGRDLCRRSVGR